MTALATTFPDWVETVTPWLISVVGIAAGVVVARLNKGGARENALLDQVQEERKYALDQLRVERDEMKAERVEMKEEREEVRSRLSSLELSLAQAAHEEALIFDYVKQLRQYIMDGSPPPPPPVPDLFAARYYLFKLGMAPSSAMRLNTDTIDLREINAPE